MVLKSLFARHGVPTTLVTDNGPQYVSQEMCQFSATYGFNHITSSPYYPQSNGLAEHSVKTVKGLFCHSPDPFLPQSAEETPALLAMEPAGRP